MALLAGLSAALLSAGPAAARDLNCFQWVAARASNVLHPHGHIAHTAPHRATGVPGPHVRRVRHVPRLARPHATPVHMIRKPIACPAHEVALQSLMPGVAQPESPQLLLAELAGPPPAADLARPAAAAIPPEEAPFFTGGPSGGGVPGFPGVLVPGGPVTSPPVVGPPVVGPPVVGPPVVGPPDTGTPPVVTPPVIEGPGPPTPPDTGTPPIMPGGGVPEPDAWALMILGFSAVGASLRRRRQVAHN